MCVNHCRQAHAYLQLRSKRIGI